MSSAVLLMLFVCVVTFPTHAETDTTRGSVGNVLCFRRTIPLSDDRCVFRCMVRLSNPTVWYPQSVRIGQTTANLRRLSDTLWLLEALQTTVDSSELELCGIVLAGSDSVCIVRLDADSLCTCTPRSLEQVLIVTSIGPPLPYLRFARLEGPFPMPVQRHDPFIIVVALDASSRVEMHLFDMLGRVLEDWSFELERGVRRLVLTLPDGFSPGLYFLQSQSNSGSVVIPIIVE